MPVADVVTPSDPSRIPEAERRDNRYWLAARGARQTDLAARFIDLAASRGLRVLALKGVAIAEELYGGSSERPMADADLLVIDTARFGEAADAARALGLEEVDASDHALVFREPVTGVVLELHISLTACPGLFTIDPEELWRARARAGSAPFDRLGNEDFILHAALHTSFQHGFAANRFHYDDFVRALDRLEISEEHLLARARVWGAERALAAMAFVAHRKAPQSLNVTRLAERLRAERPARLGPSLEKWGDSTPPATLTLLARVRFELAPSPVRWLTHTLLPSPIPGSRARRPSPLARLWRLSSHLR